jgi:hypothetical protein
MTSGERDLRLRQLREVSHRERGVLTNARCLNEGVDMPTLDGVAFIDPRQSQVDIVQAVGRAIRKAADKKLGTITIPVFVNERAVADHELEASEFDRVWSIVKALRAHDDVLAEQLDEIRRELGRRKTTIRRPAKIVLDLPLGVGMEFARAFDVKLVEATTPSWEFMYGLLLRFKECEGHLSVHPKHRIDGTPLGTWCVHQRRLKRLGKLDDVRERRLRELGFDFAPRDDRFEADVSAIEHFSSIHGHPPRTSGKTREERRLASNMTLWRRMRSTRKLPDWKRERLDNTPGFYWTTFDESLAPIARFVEAEGRRPRETVAAAPDERRLAARLRAIEKRDLSAPEASALASVLNDVAAVPSRDEHFLKRCDEVENFVAANGRLPSNQAGSAQERQLAAFYLGQRRQYNKSPDSYPADRSARLEQIPGWYWKHDLDARFERDAALVDAYMTEHGRRPPRNDPDPEIQRLGNWCSSRLREWPRLSARRRERLIAIPDLVPDHLALSCAE